MYCAFTAGSWVEQLSDLVVDVQGTLVKIERADKHGFPIKHHGLGVQTGLGQAGQPGNLFSDPWPRLSCSTP